VPRLIPILAVPLVADGCLTLAIRLQNRSVDQKPAEVESSPAEES
jgi:hypothetical protein